ncbi:MAG: SDR family NAD(P)-dependent oxidoreductase [Proteobacteria bacterium]|nr:SDR family NAD(P)-dependent oxidoreductase [Pseudomonadota bacterium]
MTLKNKVAIVTGATSGIGAATAKLFAESGAKVMMSGRDEARGKTSLETARAAAGDGGAEASFLAGDATNSAFCDRLVAAAVERFGRLDILVNNAGVIHRTGILDTTDADWLEAMAINVNALFFLSRAAIRQMTAQGEGGSIVNISSEWGVAGARGHIPYGTSKGAVVNFTRSLALDHAADGIRVNCLCPGEVRTPMLESGAKSRFGDVEGGLATIAEKIPLRRISDPIEQARAIRFLASDESSYMTGSIVVNDGGNTAA